MVTKIWFNMSSGNGLLPDDTKLLPEKSMMFGGIEMKAISQKMNNIPLITKIHLLENYTLENNVSL